MKKLLIILLILALLLTGCGRREVTKPIETPAHTPEPTEEIVESESFDPGPPHYCRISTAEDCAELLGAGTTEEALEVLIAVSDNGGMMDEREDMEKKLRMIERAPVPVLEGAELYEIEVYPDDSWNTVQYHFVGKNAFAITYFLNKDQGRKDEEKTEIWKLKPTMETEAGRFYTALVDGIRVEFQVKGRTAEEAEALIKGISFVRAEDLRWEQQKKGDTAELKIETESATQFISGERIKELSGEWILEMHEAHLSKNGLQTDDLQEVEFSVPLALSIDGNPVELNTMVTDGVYVSICAFYDIEGNELYQYGGIHELLAIAQKREHKEIIVSMLSAKSENLAACEEVYHFQYKVIFG